MPTKPLPVFSQRLCLFKCARSEVGFTDWYIQFLESLIADTEDTFLRRCWHTDSSESSLKHNFKHSWERARIILTDGEFEGTTDIKVVCACGRQLLSTVRTHAAFSDVEGCQHGALIGCWYCFCMLSSVPQFTRPLLVLCPCIHTTILLVTHTSSRRAS